MNTVKKVSIKTPKIYSIGDGLGIKEIEQLAILLDYKTFSELENRMLANMIVSGAWDDQDYNAPKSINISSYAVEFGLTEKEAYLELLEATYLLFERVISYQYYELRWNCDKFDSNSSMLIIRRFTKVEVYSRWMAAFTHDDKSLSIVIRLSPLLTPFIKNMVEKYKILRT